MEIRINTLTLRNFKGIRQATFIFNGSNARIEGENGTGKSTVFDAFTWLLFGKDHRGQDWTNFDLKPIDPETREAIHGLEHSVEAELTIDGVKTTLLRMVTEDWVKPRGSAEKVLKGHKQSFFIDGIDTATKKAYDSAIAQWINEGVFKMLTNPLFFIDDQYTDWKARRKAILGLLDNTAEDKLKDSFADLLAAMRGEPLEQFRKRVAADKKANKDRLAEATANIAAWNKALPEEIDTAEVNARIAEIEADRNKRVAVIKADIANIDAGLADINEANRERNNQVSALRRKLNEIRYQQDAYVSARLAEAAKAVSKTQEEYNKADIDARCLASELRQIDSQIKAAQGDVKTQKEFRDHDAEDLRELGTLYTKTRERMFTWQAMDVCPACGRPYPPERIEADKEEALRKFTEAQKAELQSIVAKATDLKRAITEEDGLIQGKEDLVRGLKIKRDETAARMDAAEAKMAQLSKSKEAGPSREAIEEEARREGGYLDLVREEAETNAEIARVSSEVVSVESLLLDRRELEPGVQAAFDEAADQTRALRDRLAEAAQRDRLLGMIEDEEERERTYADEVARLERLEFRAQEYVKAEVDAQEAAINALFKVCRWKMFAPTLDGGLTEMCEVTSPDGVPYRSMNDAQRILCGMDVIRVFSERSGVSAPIFVDNAESVTRKSFDTAAQVIRLVVREGTPLTTINE